MTFHEYPKMLSKDGKPLVYPSGHVRAGELVVFANVDEEVGYDNSGVVLEPVTTATTTHVAEIVLEHRDHSRQPHAMPPGLRGEVTVKVAP